MDQKKHRRFKFFQQDVSRQLSAFSKILLCSIRHFSRLLIRRKDRIVVVHLAVFQIFLKILSDLVKRKGNEPKPFRTPTLKTSEKLIPSNFEFINIGSKVITSPCLRRTFFSDAKKKRQTLL